MCAEGVITYLAVESAALAAVKAMVTKDYESGVRGSKTEREGTYIPRRERC